MLYDWPTSGIIGRDPHTRGRYLQYLTGSLEGSTEEQLEHALRGNDDYSIPPAHIIITGIFACVGALAGWSMGYMVYRLFAAHTIVGMIAMAVFAVVLLLVTCVLEMLAADYVKAIWHELRVKRAMWDGNQPIDTENDYRWRLLQWAVLDRDVMTRRRMLQALKAHSDLTDSIKPHIDRYLLNAELARAVQLLSCSLVNRADKIKLEDVIRSHAVALADIIHTLVTEYYRSEDERIARAIEAERQKRQEKADKYQQQELDAAQEVTDLLNKLQPKDTSSVK